MRSVRMDLQAARAGAADSGGSDGAGAWLTARLFAAAVFLLLLLTPAADATLYHDEPSGSITSGSMLWAVGVATDDSTGNVYVANEVRALSGFPPAAGQVFRFDPGGSPLTPPEMGTGYFGGVAVQQGGEHTVYGLSGLFSTPMISAFDSSGNAVGSPFEVESNGRVQIASDAAGNVYLPNQNNNTVEKFESDGEPATPAAFECSGSDCEGTALSGPNGVAIDSAGHVYVADTGNDRVVRFDADGSNPIVFSTGRSQAVAVDNSNGQVFVLGHVSEFLGEPGLEVRIYDSAGALLGSFGDGFLEDDHNGNHVAQIAVNSTSGLVYVSETPEVGNSKVAIFTPIAEPTATTEAASGLTSSGATLHGTVNPQEVETVSCQFEYTDDTDYQANEWANATAVPCNPNPGASGSETPVSAVLTGLNPQTTYDYRVVESTEGGDADGGVVQFTTGVPAPVATTEAATGITQTAALLHGQADAEGGVAQCKFEFGTSTSYGQVAACSVNPVTGTSPTAVGAALSGLSPNTTYHFRLVLEGMGGTAKGNDLSLTTLADTCETNAALCPPPPPPGNGGGSGGGAEESPRNEAAYKVCVKKAKKAYKKAAAKAKSRAAKKAAKTKKTKALKKCKARYL